ncbi:MAG: FHA domain-containing protein, partial [Bdellovibrionales bacterium]|nr:FHA domain-containing protein [Bdellovibrionales bacterium]
MKETALYIDHKHGSRYQRRFNVLSGGPDTIVFGANPESHIRLIGSGVSAIHAALEKRGAHWYLCDLGSSTGTWVNGTSIVERKIEEGLLVFQIGPHTLRISFTTLGRELFVSEGSDNHGPTHHQVVIKKSGRIVETHVVAKDHTFIFFDGTNSRSCPPPRGAKWEVRTFGVYEVSQRLIAAEKIRDEADFGLDPGMKKPLAAFAALIVLGFLGKVLWPSPPQDELNLKISENQYARMIYDAKLVKQKREESQKTQAGMKKLAPTQQAQTPTTETKKAASLETAGQTALIKSVRASGLSSLIGKIAKRTSKNSIAIWTQGQSPDSRGSGTVAVSASMDKLA